MLQSFKLFFNCNLVLSRSYSGYYVSRVRYLKRLKEDDEACREALKSGNFLLYHKLSPLLRKTSNGIYTLASLKTSDLEHILEKVGKDKHFVNESFLLGCTDKGEPQFSLEVGDLDRSALEQECRGMFVDLRKAFFMLPGPESPLAAKGQALLRWHQTNCFCSATGQPTIRNQSGSFRVCNSSGITYYPKMAPVVIVLVSDGSRCLLARQTMFPLGMYSALSGFCDMGESVEETLHREVAEEVGLEVENIQYSGSQHWPFPQSSFMLACHATVNPDKTQVNIDKAELEDARWFTYEEITEALRKPPLDPRREPPVFWVPPPYAIANQLIQEWANQQQLSRKLHGLE
ncbi:NAD(P)H pyrophosphatase NUDT13, mitochondrial isoform X2 [Sinocyclocheilus anshuiensis]|uniref:NAD(+) diphosphatase n=1 Tax=Sinocyclocheilus anshuiensis TaxID=1608454 RepID=A0A671SRN7_9TELE|nr:PREDICTED: nucleoside diphosphate-linked moiety X motif 13-like isoform X2 [Sinocyclocheilus anshuiensis]